MSTAYNDDYITSTTFITTTINIAHVENDSQGKEHLNS